MDFTSILALGSAFFLLFIKPGPDVIALVSRSLADGFKAGAALKCGNLLGHFTFIAFVALSYTIPTDIRIFMEIFFKSLGAALFIYMGFKGLSDLGSGQWKMRGESTPFLLENFWSGLTISLGNPITFFFYVSILPTFINMATFSFNTYLYVCMIVVLFNGGPAFLVAAMASKTKNLLKNKDTVLKINLVTSILFILLGLFIGSTAITQFDFQALYYALEPTIQNA